MADIHVLEGNFRSNGAGTIRIAYHIPVPETYRDGTIASYPEDYSRESAVVDIELAELELIQMGHVFEYLESFRVNTNIPQSTLVSQVRDRWHDVQSIAGQQVREQYKYYGTTLARS